MSRVCSSSRRAHKQARTVRVTVLHGIVSLQLLNVSLEAHRKVFQHRIQITRLLGLEQSRCVPLDDPHEE